MAKREDNGESVFQIIRRLVTSIEVIAEMMKIGDADQIRLHGKAKIFLASVIDLGESINQSQITASEAAHTDEFLAMVAHIIVSMRDWLQASATAIYDRESNSDAMDIFADQNATAIQVARNTLEYGANHEPTIRQWQERVNLDKVEEAARNQKKAGGEARVRELINALERGLEGRA